MNLIAQISTGIKAHVCEFWKGVPVDQNKLVINAEQILSIYGYVAQKAHSAANLKAQIMFCKQFSTRALRNKKQGFCLITLEMALDNLIS
mmetsp:Transcript_8012/g.11186  ORF Transcript_8012/g.11186 Transcript_8012/m.11186 type:complete len:90 (+) Transcript_8012:360-629(+)